MLEKKSWYHTLNEVLQSECALSLDVRTIPPEWGFQLPDFSLGSFLT